MDLFTPFIVFVAALAGFAGYRKAKKLNANTVIYVIAYSAVGGLVTWLIEFALSAALVIAVFAQN